MPTAFSFDATAQSSPRIPSIRDADAAVQAAQLGYVRVLGAWTSDLLELRRTRIASATWTNQQTLTAWPMVA